jgi:tRNA pseudouridine13 synthase
MWAAQSDAGALEEAIQAAAGVTVEDWRRAKVDGTRRYGRILVPDLTITTGESDMGEALVFAFTLPKGSFATVVLRELMKVDLSEVAELDSDTE